MTLDQEHLLRSLLKAQERTNLLLALVALGGATHDRASTVDERARSMQHLAADPEGWLHLDTDPASAAPEPPQADAEPAFCRLTQDQRASLEACLTRAESELNYVRAILANARQRR